MLFTRTLNGTLAFLINLSNSDLPFLSIQTYELWNALKYKVQAVDGTCIGRKEKIRFEPFVQQGCVMLGN